MPGVVRGKGEVGRRREIVIVLVVVILGLGLALVKSITERHGGSVRCEDRPGGGASFVITLPH